MPNDVPGTVDLAHWEREWKGGDLVCWTKQTQDCKYVIFND